MADPDEPDPNAPTQRPKRATTKLYGAIDLPGLESLDELQPATLAESSVFDVPSGVQVGGSIARFVVDDVLGRGGMGEVLSGRDEQIGRSVAIKRLRIANPSPEVLVRFLREVRIQGRLEHPAVVPVHELSYDEDGKPFFVMKQLAGTTLAELLPRLARGEREAEEKFSRQQLLRAFADVCLAIEFAHMRGVIHRDLKPANIVLGDFGEVYVLDWGIARAAEPSEARQSFADIDTVRADDDPAPSDDTVAGAILGTPGYISPEQIQTDPSLDGRADVYALGCILFEILTLESLHGRGQGALASALAGADARASIRAPDRDIPPELDAICVRATAVDRDQRFDSARQLATAVQRFLDGNRDLELRARLARSELGQAQLALAANTPDTRRIAIRSAARALALDPKNREAADIVGRLMLEPPAETPPEVEAELDRIDEQSLRTSARFGTIAAVAYLAFFPLMYLTGFRDPWPLAAGVALSLAIVVCEAVLAPRARSLWPRYIAMACSLGIFAVFSLLVSPVVFGPGPPIIMITLLAGHRKLIPTSLTVVLTSAAALSPFLLELAGVVDPYFSIAGGDLVVHTRADELASFAPIALAFYVVALAQFAGLLGRLLDDDRRGVRRAMQTHAWQLRQLVPRDSSAPPQDSEDVSDRARDGRGRVRDASPRRPAP